MSAKKTRRDHEPPLAGGLLVVLIAMGILAAEAANPNSELISSTLRLFAHFLYVVGAVLLGRAAWLWLRERSR